MDLVNELFSEIGHQMPLDKKQFFFFCKSILENDNYVVFLSNNHNGYSNGVITLSEGLSIHAGGKFGIIREFYVVPKFRSTGIGKKLLERAKEFGQKKNWNRIEVTLPDKMKSPRTYNFYVREGFKEIGPRLKLEILNN